VVLGAAAGRTTFEETIERTDARLTGLAELRYRLANILVTHLDRLADGAPVEQTATELIRAVDAFAGRREGATVRSYNEFRDSSPRRARARVALDNCVEAFRTWLHLPEPGHLYVTLASVVGNLLPSEPVWLLVVGSPSSGKTEVLHPLSGLPYVHQAATLTEAALLSGTPRKERAEGARGGLLRVLDEFGIIVCKDFTSVLAQNRDSRAQVLAALREIYDGEWTRHVGTDGGRTLHWKGKLGLLGGVTTAIDPHHSVIAMMGDRFVLYRLDDSPEMAAATSMSRLGGERQMRTELAVAVGSVIEAADRDVPLVLTDPDERQRIVTMAAYTTRSRTNVDRDGYDHEVQAIPQAEGPARFAIQLRLIQAGLEAIGLDRDDTWPYLTKLACDSIPTSRRYLIDVMAAADGPLATARLATVVGIPTNTARRHLEDLVLLGVLTREKRGTHDNAPDYWCPTDWLRWHWTPVPESQQRDNNHALRRKEGISGTPREDADTFAEIWTKATDEPPEGDEP
jgi:hypothetical protein